MADEISKIHLRYTKMSRKHGFRKLDVTSDLDEPFKKDASTCLNNFYMLMFKRKDFYNVFS